VGQRVERLRLRPEEDCFEFDVKAGLCDSTRGRRQVVLTSSSPLCGIACGGVFLDNEELGEELCDTRKLRLDRPRVVF
jgi:hypothetical protein